MKKVEIARNLVQTFLQRGSRTRKWLITEGLEPDDVLVAARFNRDSRNLELFFSEKVWEPEELATEPFFPVIATATSCRIIVEELPK